MLLGLWVLNIFGSRVSGGHYNPAISLAFIFKKNLGNFPRLLGLAYILFQIIGGFFGATIAWFFTGSKSGAFVYLTYSNFIFQAIVAETFGTFIVTLFFLMQTESKTKFSKDKSICCLVTAASYIGARSMLAARRLTYSGAVLNPAIAFGSSIIQFIAMGFEGFEWVWLYTFVPFGGGLLAVLFFEFAFKKTQEVLEEGESQPNGQNEGSLLLG